MVPEEIAKSMLGSSPVARHPRLRKVSRPSHGSREPRWQQVLRTAEKQFASVGIGATTMAALAKASGVSEPMLYRHFGSKRKLFEEVVRRNFQDRLAVLEERFQSIPSLPPLEFIAALAESTVLACVDDTGNASVMALALIEIPEFAADLYRAEIGTNEALWETQIGARLANSPLRSGLAVHLAPYAVHTCMAFGLWLAALRHKSATAQPHARQYADAVAHVARSVLMLSQHRLDAAS